MAIAGMGFGSPPKLPEHSTWVGAVAGGLAEGVQTAKQLTGTLIHGGMETYPDQNGKRKFIPISRLQTANLMKEIVKADVYRHTRSVADPPAYQRWNAAVDRFQAGDKSAMANLGAGCGKPYGISQ